MVLIGRGRGFGLGWGCCMPRADTTAGTLVDIRSVAVGVHSRFCLEDRAC